MATKAVRFTPAQLKQLAGLGWGDLGQFKRAGRFPDDYPPDTLTFYSPRDPGVLQVILWTLLQARHSIVAAMYGFDLDQAAELIIKATKDSSVYVQLALDKTQAGGVHERKILRRFNHHLFGNSISIGHSARGAITHDKMLLIDGQYLIDGSTNWSDAGTRKQDNQLTLSRDRARCAEARAIIDLIHDTQLEQMAG